MKRRIAFLLFFCIIIWLLSNYPLIVENYYSNKFFPAIASTIRLFTRFIPFSIGDLLYLFVVFLILFSVINLFYRLFSYGFSSLNYKAGFLNSLKIIFWIYLIFNVLWGLNYNRMGVAYQLKLNAEPVSKSDLIQLNNILLQRVNFERNNVSHSNIPFMQTKTWAVDAYKIVSKKYPFLEYKNADLKSSMWGWLGNYTGFTGYYNPFSGEAQVNTNVPSFLQPYIACHEIAHQLGYAKENEANFVGFLAAEVSNIPEVKYSAYLDLFSYANRSLYFLDSSSAIQFRNKLSLPVINDINVWRDFNRRHQNPVEPVIRWLYGKFLLSNNQPAGIYSYDRVIVYLVAYYKQKGLM